MNKFSRSKYKHYIVAIILIYITIIGRTLLYSKQIGIISEDNVKLFYDKSKNSKIVCRLNKNEEFEILGRDKVKSRLNGFDNYWYKAFLKDGKIGWIFGKYIKRKPGSSLDWNIIYLDNKYDPEEYKDFFPFEVDPLSTLVVYKNSELSDYLVLYSPYISKVEVIGRRDRGFPIFMGKDEVKHHRGFLEVYKVKVVLSDFGVKTKNIKVIEGFIKCDEVIKKDEKISSSSNKFYIWKSNNMACGWYEPSGDYIDMALYFLENMYVTKYLGIGNNIKIYFSPNDEYFLFSGKIYNWKGELLLNPKDTLSSPTWCLEQKKVYLRHMNDNDSIYLVNLDTRSIKKIFELQAKKEEHFDNYGDSIVEFKPVIYDNNTNTITAEFERVIQVYEGGKYKSSIHRKYTILLNDEGKIIQESFVEKER